MQPRLTRLVELIFIEFFAHAGYLKPADNVPVAVARARMFIDLHFNTIESLDQVSGEAALSKAHLIRLFKQHVGLTPMNYLWRLRLDHAARYLTETSYSIAHISEQCGFQNPYHFSRMFKQHYGRPPRGFRQQSRAL